MCSCLFFIGKKLNASGVELIFFTIGLIWLKQISHLSNILFKYKYFITLPFDVCKLRRVKHNYIPPEPFETYFEDIYWPVYEAQLVEAKQRHDLSEWLLIFNIIQCWHSRVISSHTHTFISYHINVSVMYTVICMWPVSTLHCG